MKIGKNRRALIAIAGTAAMSFALSACAAQSDATTAAEDGLKIGFFSAGAVNAYQEAAVNGAKAAAELHGVEIEFFESNFDVQTQNNQLQLALQRGELDGWVLGPDSDTEQCDIVTKASDSGIPIMLWTARACGEEIEPAIGYVGTQTPELYREWWDYIVSDSDGGKMAVLTGPPLLSITQFSEDAMNEALSAHPEFQLVASHNTDYTTGQAYQMTLDTLNANPDLKILVTNYAGLTKGAVEAIKAAGREGEVQVYDLLGDRMVLDNLQSGAVTMTIPGMPYDEGYYAVDALVRHANGDSIDLEYNPASALDFNGAPFLTPETVDTFKAQY